MLVKLIHRFKSHRFSDIINKGTLYINVLFNKSGIISDDALYKKKFIKFYGPKIYQMHLTEYFICCAFCKNLRNSNCHENCFKCGLSTYEECAPLLPGIFSFKDSHFDAIGSESVPWIFKTPCTNYERLSEKLYFKNFNSQFQSIAVANFEVLEGIFIGIYRNKRPCHICACLNFEIFNKCTQSDKTEESIPCINIIEKITSKYSVILGMVKYAD